MEIKSIAFTEIGKAEIVSKTVADTPAAGQVLVRTEYSAVSAGTERANLMGMPNTPQRFPCWLGYSSVGRVAAVGEGVKRTKVGERVLVYHGIHAAYNLVREDQITPVKDENIDPLEASFVIIASMGLGGVRRLEVELGESAMVFGLGLLGMFSIECLSLSGAYPLIAADYDENRRKKALELGADYALSPAEPDFIEKVKALTGGRGVSATVEVTGASAAMIQALDCAARMGRISLLGCSRVSTAEVDYYSQVHKPGIQLIGAHNMVRPKVESYPHHWTHQDDCTALLSLLGAGKLKVREIISEVHGIEDAPEVYSRLSQGKLPLGVAFRW